VKTGVLTIRHKTFTIDKALQQNQKKSSIDLTRRPNQSKINLLSLSPMTRKLQTSPDKFKFITERSIRAEKFNRTLWIIRKVAEICLIATPHTPTTPFVHPLVQLNQLRYNTEDIHIHYPDRCSYPGCLDDVIGDPHGFESYCIHHYNYIDPNR
jgi:hypothetical protein